MADSSTKIMKTLNEYEVCDAVARGMSPVVATRTETADGEEIYTAEVNGITTLTTGLNFVIVPDKKNTSNTPKLNVNNLGDRPIRLRISTTTRTTNNSYAITGEGEDAVSFLAEGAPVRVMYDGDALAEGNGAWVTDFTIPDANHLYGIVPIENGGTGADTVGKARINLGLGGVGTGGTGALSIANGGTGCTTEEQLKGLIKSAGVSGEDGIVPITAGGTGASTVGQAITNLGAAPVSHSHDDAYLSKSGGDITGNLNVSGATTLSGGATVSNGLNTSSVVVAGGLGGITGNGNLYANNFKPLTTLYSNSTGLSVDDPYVNVAGILDYKFYIIFLKGMATPLFGYRVYQIGNWEIRYSGNHDTNSYVRSYAGTLVVYDDENVTNVSNAYTCYGKQRVQLDENITTIIGVA